MVPGATNTFLHLEVVPRSPDAGDYRVQVRNLFGSVLSSPPATLTVRSPPVFTLQPKGGYAPVGGTFTFETAVTGDSPVGFQWHRDGGALPGADERNLTLYHLQEIDTGGYSLWVTNPVGQA